MKQQLRGKELFLVGVTLFSMFFGAGNLIFPPFVGYQAGAAALPAFLGMALTAVCFPVLGVVAVAKVGGTDKLCSKIHPYFAIVFTILVYLCIGPMLAIPRTAATTYETSVAPLLSGVSPVVFSIVFFLLVFLLCVRETAVVDIVGKVLTPALLAGLLVLIVVGVVHPMGPVGEAPLVENVAATGIEAGYQTMDVLATLLFGYIILKSALEKGHNTQKSQARVVAGASVVAGIGLLVVYLGLTYLGATMSQFFDITVDRTYLVTSIVQGLLGQGGIILFAVVVALACLTTAVGLVSSCSAYFTGLSKGRISYPVMVFLLCLFSGVVSNFGINEIIAIATPILSVVYPPTLVLIVLALGGKALHRRCWIHRMAALGALAVSLLEVIGTYTGLEMTFLAHLPLADLGFGWALPAAICGLVGVFIPAKAPLAKE